MFIKLLIIFTFIPILELYLLIEAGRLIGTAPTILLIFLTGVAGAWLARSQGVAVIQRIQAEMAKGQMPAGSLLDGALIMAGGLLLLTPGFCTDLLGFSCLAPFTRIFWRRLLATWLERQMERGNLTIRRF